MAGRLTDDVAFFCIATEEQLIASCTKSCAGNFDVGREMSKLSKLSKLSIFCEILYQEHCPVDKRISYFGLDKRGTAVAVNTGLRCSCIKIWQALAAEVGVTPLFPTCWPSLPSELAKRGSVCNHLRQATVE